MNDGWGLYTGPLDYYWNSYNAELMFFFLGVAVFLRVLYGRNGRLAFATSANVFGGAGLLTFAAIMIVDSVRAGDATPMLGTLAILALMTYAQWLFAKP